MTTAKTVAEKEAWAIAREQDQWDLLTVNPAWILGPSLQKRGHADQTRQLIRQGGSWDVLYPC